MAGELDGGSQKRKKTLKLVAAIAAAVALFVGMRLLGFDKGAIVGWIDSLGFWAPVIFICAYVVATVFLAPASLLTLAAGAAFGLVWGTVYVSIASTLGASASFLIGRYLARGWVDEKISGNEKFAAVDKAVAREGWKIVALTRLSPAFPFNLLNYAYGLTRVAFTPYALASWVAMIPGTVMYVYIGSLAQAPAGRTPGQWILLAVGLLATIGATLLITRAAKKALKAKLPTGG